MSGHVISAGSQRTKSTGPKGPKLPQTKEEWFDGDRLFVILEMACLETVKTRKGYELLNSDDHHGILNKAANKGNKSLDVSMYRPDIVHQALLALLDSPLNKAGKLKIFIRTQKNVIIDVNPKLRIPRTYNRFAGLMVQLLYQFRIKAKTSNEKLLKVIKNPITNHLPPNVAMFGMSKTGTLVNVHEWIPTNYNQRTFTKGKPVALVFGAHPHGKIQGADYINDANWIAVSQYALSSAAAISRALNGFEKYWNVL
eukprot:CAMPEP_0202713680 /NCGR_PEP_ID=MMETSP1385-20130828/57778_1 /ASSEMBLY_ACC=CAM_ASM_000861 /TAXON_ID=933848 /ORGANISM="Elphidium margaritaceum" /LENGTH=254 /DNA_ID=CAMNT_0049374107 /DNA_START=26 /DNA_END=790 /DNA_ORIENTATION=-